MSVELPSQSPAHSDPPALAYDTPIVVTDLTLSHNSLSAHPLPRWRQIMKDLHLHSTSTGLYMHVAEKGVDKLTENDQVVLDIRISDDVPDTCPDKLWESRSGGVWLLKGRYNGDSNQAVTAVDLLFGADAVDPRPKWTLLQSFLHLGTRPDVPVSRLSIRHGRAIPSIDRPRLQVREDGTFKIVQISDTHGNWRWSLQRCYGRSKSAVADMPGRLTYSEVHWQCFGCRKPRFGHSQWGSVAS